MSDLFGNHIVGFPTRRLKLCVINIYKILLIFEPPHEKTNNLQYAKTKMQISCAVTDQLISIFVEWLSTVIKYQHS